MLLLLAVFVAFAFADDPNACAQWPTCEICLEHNLCGWCADPVIYEDGSPGVHCAGKPADPNNPPPGFKKWTCPHDYQNKACYGYLCNNQTFQCESSGAPGHGVPLAQCIANCFPPTYECNATTFQCFQTTPGHGTDKPHCEEMCRNDLYVCTPDATCKHAPPGGGGVPLNQCQQSCKPSNVTPPVLLGTYRGLEVSSGYIAGEWDAQINPTSATIYQPNGAIWEQGNIQTFESQLWLATSQGVRKGIYSLDQLPEVEVLTWGLGELGQGAPPDYNTAMRTATVLVLARCINGANCQFNIKEYLRAQFRKRQVDDPCSVYPDCQSCVDAPKYCGWCSVPVLYNNTIVGRNCAGLNKTITPPFNCTGSFSIESCSTTTSTSGTTTTTTGTTGTTGTSGTTGTVDLYTCDPDHGHVCLKTPTGNPKDVCLQQCFVVPIVPILLRGKSFRGLEIELNYLRGEWHAKFGNTTVTFTSPDGSSRTATVSTSAQILTLTFGDGSVRQTLWQYQGGPATDFLSWAWGAPNGPAPASFDQAMTANGMQEFFYVTCPEDSDPAVCSWKFR